MKNIKILFLALSLTIVFIQPAYATVKIVTTDLNVR